MKVVHINKTDAGGGAAVAALRIHRALLASGVDSHFFVQEQRRSEVGEHCAGAGTAYKMKNFCRFLFERLCILPHEKDPSIRYNFSIANTGMSLADYDIIRSADVINLHWINQGFLSMDSLAEIFALGKPVVWTLHDMWPFTGGCHYAGSCYEFNERCGYCTFLRDRNKDDFSSQIFQRKKDIYARSNLTIVACSNWLNTLAKNSSLFRNMPTHVVPNPLDTNFYRPLDKAQCRKELGLPLDKRLLLFGAANISDVRKGYRYLEEALLILQENFPKICSNIQIITFGHAKSHRRSPLTFKTYQYKYISNPQMLVKIYNAADVFVLPSIQDNLPNTVVESLSCSTPVVGFRVGGVPEIVTHCKTGYLAEMKNALSLADGIYNTLLFNGESYRDAARQYALERFANDVVAKKYIDVYNEAINR